MQDYFNEIESIITNNRFNWLRMVRCRPYLVDYINTNVSEDFKCADLKTQVYSLINHLEKRPTCPVCGNPIMTPVKTITNGFDFTCGKKACFQKISVNHMQETCLKKYGTKWASQVPEIQKKIQEHTFEKYGVNCVFKSDIIKERAQKTNFEKYGFEIASKSDVVKEKAKKTCLEKYGVEYTAQSEKIKKKIIETCIKRYGLKNAGGTKESLEKIRKSTQEKYGYDSYFGYMHHTPQVKQKILERNKLKYGFECPQKSDIVKKKIIEAAINKYGCSSVNTAKSFNLMLSDPYTEPCFTPEELYNSKDKNLKFKCKKCGREFMAIHKNGIHSRCNVCFPMEHKQSEEESEVYEFLREILPDCEIIRHERSLIKPLEIDMYVPSKNIAIEFDGLYWHSMDINKNKNYHLLKTEACLKKGVHLIHIFENEWNNKRDIVKSRIKNIFGINKTTVFARKCEVREIENFIAKDFINKYHIQGFTNGKVRLGLFYKDELLAVMTFSKPRFNKLYEWELVRYCVKFGYHIPGGASKLLSYFEKKYHPMSLVSYADRRWSNGGLYESIGFTFKRKSRPNYWYFKTGYVIELESRIKYQKHKLPTLLDSFDKNLSEQENMKNNGFSIIYDCGNLVYVKEYSSK